jgi:signal peptidase I
MQPWEQRDADRQMLELSMTQTTSQPPKPVSELRYIRELAEMVIFVVILFFLVRGVVQNFLIEGQSMEPNLHSGQFILVNKLANIHFDLNAPQRLLGKDVAPEIVYPIGMPTYGEVVVFEYPNDPSKDYIKRVIGLPGDTIEFRDAMVFVNGQQLVEPYLQGAPTYCHQSDECASRSITVAPNTLFVLGDNRENSSDSREWGGLPFDRVIGQAWVVYWPYQTIGPIIQFQPLPTTQP